MKIALSLLLTLFCFSSHAFDIPFTDVIAKYRTGSRSPENVVSTFVIDIDEAGFLFLNEEIPTDGGKFILKDHGLLQVQTEEFTELSKMIQTLSNAKIIETFSEIICPHEPAPEQRIDHLLIRQEYNASEGYYEGALKLALSPHKCWSAKKTTFEDPANIAIALELKQKLIDLAIPLAETNGTK